MTGPAPGWLDSAIARVEQGEACALVTVAVTDGSAPREAGSKMLVHRDGIAGSIGGGHLELMADRRARALIAAASQPSATLADFALGPGLGQCCGGRVTVLIETLGPEALVWLRAWHDAGPDQVIATCLDPFAKVVLAAGEGTERPDLAAGFAALSKHGATAQLVRGTPCYLLERMADPRDDLFLFGAGHVGRALAQILGLLPYRVHWIDPRAEMFPEDAPANIEIEVSAAPHHDVGSAPAGCFFLVMTHSHALDFDICDQILERGDFAFLGLIGSASKRASFVRRLRARGHGEAALERLTCPIGLPEVTGKEPVTIAVAAAGQLLALSEARARSRRPQISEHPRVRRRGVS